MNSRIDELAKQCWSHRVQGSLIDGQLHFDHKKFAELIVRECAKIADNPAPGAFTSIGNDIIKHFGVEE